MDNPLDGVLRDCSLLLHAIHTEGDTQRMLFLAKQNSLKDLFVTKFLDKLFVWKERSTGVPNVCAFDLIRTCTMYTTLSSMFISLSGLAQSALCLFIGK